MKVVVGLDGGAEQVTGYLNHGRIGPATKIYATLRGDELTILGSQHPQCLLHT